jgi:hypothetical protein
MLHGERHEIGVSVTAWIWGGRRSAAERRRQTHKEDHSVELGTKAPTQNIFIGDGFRAMERSSRVSINTL